MSTLQAELQQLQQQLAAKDASMAELQQETERRAADSSEARQQLQQLQQEVAELQAQQQTAGQQAQQRLMEVHTSPCYASLCSGASRVAFCVRWTAEGSLPHAMQ